MQDIFILCPPHGKEGWPFNLLHASGADTPDGFVVGADGGVGNRVVISENNGAYQYYDNDEKAHIENLIGNSLSMINIQYSDVSILKSILESCPFPEEVIVDDDKGKFFTIAEYLLKIR